MADFDPFAGGADVTPKQCTRSLGKKSVAPPSDGFDPFAGGNAVTPKAGTRSLASRTASGLGRSCEAVPCPAAPPDSFDPFAASGGGGGSGAAEQASASASAPAPPPLSLKQRLASLREQQQQVRQYDDNDFLDTEEVFRRKQAGALRSSSRQVSQVQQHIDQLLKLISTRYAPFVPTASHDTSPAKAHGGTGVVAPKPTDKETEDGGGDESKVVEGGVDGSGAAGTSTSGTGTRLGAGGDAGGSAEADNAADGDEDHGGDGDDGGDGEGEGEGEGEGDGDGEGEGDAAKTGEAVTVERQALAKQVAEAAVRAEESATAAGAGIALRRETAQELAIGLHTMARTLLPKHTRTVQSNAGFKELLLIIQRHVQYFDARCCARVLWTLARINHRVPRLLDMITQVFVAQTATLDCEAVCEIMFALGKLTFQPNRVQIGAIIGMLEGVVPELAPTQLCNCVWSLATLGHKSATVLDDLLARAIAVLPKFTPMEAMNFCWAIARLELRNEVFLSNMCTYITFRAHEMTVTQYSAILNAFAALGFNPGPAILEQITMTCVVEISALSAHNTSQILWAFTKLGQTFTEEQRRAFYVQLENTSHQMKPDDICRALEAFTLVDVDQRPPGGLLTLMDSCAKILASQFRATEVVMLRAAYGKLGMSTAWIVEIFGVEEKYDADSVEAKTIASLPVSEIVGFLKMSARKRAHPGPILGLITQEFVRQIDSIRPSDVAGALRAYASFGTRDAALLEMSQQHFTLNRHIYAPNDIASCLWAYGILRFNCPDVLEMVSAHELCRLSEYSPSQLTNAAWAFAKLSSSPREFVFAVCDETASREFAGFGKAHLSTLAWVHGRVEDSPNEGKGFLVTLGRHVLADSKVGLNKFSPPELVDFLWGVAKTLRRERYASVAGTLYAELEQLSLHMSAIVTKVMIEDSGIDTLGGQELADLVWTVSFFALRKHPFSHELLRQCAVATIKHIPVFRAAAVGSVICAFAVFSDPSIPRIMQFHPGEKVVALLFEELVTNRDDAVKNLAATAFCNLISSLHILRWSPAHQGKGKNTELTVAEFNERVAVQAHKFSLTQILGVTHGWLMLHMEMRPDVAMTCLQRISDLIDVTKAELMMDMLAKLLVILSTPTVSNILLLTDGRRVAFALWESAWTRAAQIAGTDTRESGAIRLLRKDALMLQMSIARSGTTDLGVAPRRHVSPYRLACPLSLIPENFEQAIKAEWMKKEMSRLSHGSPRQRIANDIARVLRRECSVSCKIGHRLTDSRSSVVTESARHVLVIADIATFPEGTTEDEMRRTQPSCCIMIASDFDVILNGPQYRVHSLRGEERLRADIAASTGVWVRPIPLLSWKVRDFAAQSTASPDSMRQRQLLRRLLTLNTDTGTA